ncbi:phage tail assembly protein [Acinetobacter sp. B5B]|uniref:phage tail assembly protein n=1 Tax=Acinetobacter baretiae TaxID=2605383 RepID=UPI0018C3238D|nr:phage tail assembly protein [Acinetobacter baretiae]MBF7683854.1 phage tail assembly protein [Acinetobacter baretiae]
MNTQLNTEVIENPNLKVIELKHGFYRGDNLVTSITMFKPNTGHCRGLSLKDVLSFNIDSLAVLLPRITTPAITAQNVYQLELMDTLKIAEEITNFLAPTEAYPTE